MINFCLFVQIEQSNNILSFDAVKQTQSECIKSKPSNNVEPMVIGAVPSTVTQKQQETYHKMIERVKDFHNKLDLTKHAGKGKVDMFVCSICFNIFEEQDLLRNHFIKVCLQNGNLLHQLN